MAEAGSQLRSRGEWTLRVLRRGDGGPRGARSPVVAPSGLEGKGERGDVGGLLESQR